MKRLIYLFSLFLFYSYTTLFIFVITFSALSFLEYSYGINIPFVELFENHPKVYVPLLGLKINIPMNFAVLIMWTVMSYYAIYFFFVKEFARIFIKSNIFEQESLRRLRFFMILNFIPLVYIIVLVSSIFMRGVNFSLEDDYFIVLAHTVIALLIYLYLDILKKGRYIQKENDLTI